MEGAAKTKGSKKDYKLSIETAGMETDEYFSENESDEDGKSGKKYQPEAHKILDGSLSFREYETALEGENDEEAGFDKKKPVKHERFKKIRKFLPPALEGLMGQANMCFVKGDHDSALKMCLEIIRQVPTAPEPFQTLAELYEEKGMKEKSLQFAMIAAHLNPRDSEQWIILGERSIQLENLTDAITCYTRAVKYDPTNIRAHIVKCQLLEQKGDRKAAIKAYHKLVDSVKPDCGAQILEYAKIVARHYHEDNEIQKAKEVMETAFSKVPKCVTSEDVNLYVELLMMLKEYMKALEVIAKYCDVKIEAEEDIVADSLTQQIDCSSFRVLSCDIPQDIPIQIHVKLIVILVHMKSCHFLNSLLTPFLTMETVEQSGDLYIDIIEALMSEGVHIEALKLLNLLIESKNYSLPAVWLNYAECLKHLGRLEEAVSAYLMVMTQAPKHVEARLMVSQLLNELGRSEEAISVLTQDPNSGSLDAGLLYERCLLLNGLSERTDEFLAVGRLLLSRHCVKITKPDDLKVLSKIKGHVRKQEALKKSIDNAISNEPELIEGHSLPTSDGEWDLFLKLCKTAYDTKQYALLERLAFSALGSPVLNSNEKREAAVFFIALLSCYYNKDCFHGYNFARDLILSDKSKIKVWNLLNLMLLGAEDTRHFRFIMRQLSKNPTHPALTMLYANNCFISGTYKYALSEYMSAYKQEPSAILAFMIALTLLQMSCQKFCTKKNFLLTQSIAFLWQYKEYRGDFNIQEVHYNMGRFFHQLGFFPVALFHYKKALKVKSSLESFGTKFDLKRETAFNIYLIYLNSGSFELASHLAVFNSEILYEFLSELFWRLHPLLELFMINKIEYVQRNLRLYHLKEMSADNVSFINFCQLCSKIREAHNDKKVNVLQNYIECWKRKANDWENSQSEFNCSFFPVLRLLLPQLDRERGAYGVKEHSLAKMYIRILSLPKEGSDAAKLLEYRAPKGSGNGGRDFAEVAYWILKKRCAEGGQLSIKDINNYLDRMAAKHASSDARGVDSELISLLKETSAEEQKWIIRILLKDMKLGIGHNGILKSYHPDAKDMYEANNNLKKVCDVLKDSKVRLHEIEVELFSPLKPMLAEECNFQKLDTYLKRSNFFYVETKLDGERFQLHKSEGDYKYFSRNGYDYSTKFGRTRFEGVLTPKIADQFKNNVNSCILDGEMMSWNLETETFASKGKNIDVKNLKEGDTYRPCFCVFDVLYYNGKVLTNQPLCSRLEILEEIVNPLKGVICFVSRKRISSKDEVLDSLNEVMDNKEEGIVMKEFMSPYKPNVRLNGGWYKIKPEYIDGLSDTLDLLILGGYYGSGRHQGKISHFLLGVAVSVEDDSVMFYSVSRVGTGYSLNELSELQNKLNPHWELTKPGEMPPSIEWAKEKPDVWIPPAKSFILEIRAAEITSSNLFKTGYTLRFPRVEKVRYDKLWKNCLTLEEFEEKRKMASGKLFSHHMTSMGNESNEKKKKSPHKSKVLGSQFRGIDISNIENVSSLLAGKEICVFSGFGNTTKDDVERKIVEFGGSLTQNPGKNTFCILAETQSTIRIKNVIKSDAYDLIKTSWFYSQLNEENSSLPQLKPQNFLAMSSRTKEIFAKSYDEFGDHYITPVTDASFKELMENIKCADTHLSNDDKYNIDVELFSGYSPYSLFRFCNVYFDRFPEIENPSSGLLPELEIVELDLKFYGGHCSVNISDETTHVVLFSGDLTRLKEFSLKNSERTRKFHIVTEHWVQSSIRDKSLSTYGYLSEHRTNLN